MCGIFGYVGQNTNVGEMVLDGLKLLEYRGYDSWGIAIKVKRQNSSVRQAQNKKGESEAEIVVERHVGKIGDAKVNLPKSNIGIGHTRWATHGGGTVKNGHPHLDCTKKIAVVHNGIIENYQELKEDLLKKGHKFLSETDTEIFPHLIEEYLASQGEALQNFGKVFRLAFNQIKGLNAIVAINSQTNEIAAAKTGSPLIIGKDKEGIYIASDASGIVKYTKDVIFLEDYQMIVLGSDLKLFLLPEGKRIEPKFTTLEWTFEDAQKGKYKHFLIKEISEQPKVLQNIAINYDQESKNLAGLIKEAYGTFMLGCGSASYAAMSGVYSFSKIAKKHVNFSIGSEFKYLEDYLTPRSLVIPISQSGETIDVVEPVSKAKNKGARIAALINVMGSSLYRQADFRFMLGAGQEKAVIGTKSFTSMFAILLLCAYTLAEKQEEGKRIILLASENVSKILEENLSEIKKLAKILKNTEHVYILGRGLSYAAALEGTLKLKETSYIHAEGFAGGELKHGVIALIEKGTPCFIIAPNDETYDEIISNAQEVKARGGFIIGVGPRINDTFDVFLRTDDIKEATLIPQIVYFQLLGYFLALEKGIKDPDKPRNLAKSVTVK